MLFFTDGRRIGPRGWHLTYPGDTPTRFFYVFGITWGGLLGWGGIQEKGGATYLTSNAVCFPTGVQAPAPASMGHISAPVRHHSQLTAFLHREGLCQVNTFCTVL